MLPHIRKILQIAGVVLIALALVGFHWSSIFQKPVDDILLEFDSTNRRNHPMTIHFWGSPRWYYTAYQESFDECYQGKYLDKSMRCESVTGNFSYKDVDAIIFRGKFLKPKTNFWSEMIKRRTPNQHWVFFESEPPFKAWDDIIPSTFDGVFNLSSTYSMDSDIPWQDKKRIKNCSKDLTKFAKLKGTDFTKKKTRNVTVAWFVSRCLTQSQRERYVKQLMNYIDVDIYGKCGPLTCGAKETMWIDRCNERLLHEKNSYKFYLAFENSLCDDYVTEKLWKLMPYDVIPIVMGGVDYSQMMPDDSYIDAKDFPVPKKLARYLEHLDEDDDEYNRILRNKRSLVCIPDPPFMPYHCRLCKYLHENRKKKKVLDKMESFWGADRCKFPKEYFSSKSDVKYRDPEKTAGGILW